MMEKLARETTNLRQTLGESQTEFGRRFGITAMSVSRWERRESPIPTGALLTMGKLAGAKCGWVFWNAAGISKADAKAMLGVGAAAAAA